MVTEAYRTAAVVEMSGPGYDRVMIRSQDWSKMFSLFDMPSIVSRASAERFSRQFGAISRSLFGLVASALCMLGLLVPQSALHAAPQQQYLLFDGIDDEVSVPHGADFQFS